LTHEEIINVVSFIGSVLGHQEYK